MEGRVSIGTALLGCDEDRGAGRGVTVHHPHVCVWIRTVLVRHRVAQHTVPGFRQQRWAALSQLARESAAVRRSTGPRAAPLAPARQRTVRATGRIREYESTRVQEYTAAMLVGRSRRYTAPDAASTLSTLSSRHSIIHAAPELHH